MAWTPTDTKKMQHASNVCVVSLVHGLVDSPPSNDVTAHERTAYVSKTSITRLISFDYGMPFQSLTSVQDFPLRVQVDGGGKSSL